jgi:hypothetical protein
LDITEKMDSKQHALLNIAEVKLNQELYDDAIKYSNLSLDFTTGKATLRFRRNILALSVFF